jgi:hypothetical protein
MPLADFTYGMEKMMEDHELLYGSLIKDVYNQGVVLGKKYRLLRAAYNTFMYGLIATVSAFLIAAIFFSHPGTARNSLMCHPFFEGNCIFFRACFKGKFVPSKGRDHHLIINQMIIKNINNGKSDNSSKSCIF